MNRFPLPAQANRANAATPGEYRRRRSLLLLLLLGLLILALLPAGRPAPASAYTIERHAEAVTGQFVMSPTSIELDMIPGESQLAEVVVANRIGKSVDITISTEDFEGSGDPSQSSILLGTEPSPRGAKSWLEPELTTITLNQGETLTFKVRITVPQEVEPGGHYAVLFASYDAAATDDQGTGVKVRSRLGCFFLIRTPGVITEEGSIDAPEIQSLSQYGPIDVGLVFNNTGNIHLKPRGRIVVTNFLGQTVADLPVREWTVLPDASRRNLVQWDRHYLFGRFTAHAEIEYGAEGRKLVATTTFWVIPWRLLLVAFALLTVIVYLVSRKLRGKRLIGRTPPAAPGATPGPAAQAPPPPAAPKMVALGELFPAMKGTGVVDVNDEETRQLVRKLIEEEVDLARSYIKEGKVTEARRQLEDAKRIAQRLEYLDDVVAIDSMLRLL